MPENRKPSAAWQSDATVLVAQRRALSARILAAGGRALTFPARCAWNALTFPARRRWFAAPNVRFLAAVAMVAYDQAAHTIFIFYGPEYWTKSAHIVFWFRFFDDPTYHAYWSIHYAVAITLLISAMVRWRRDLAAAQRKAAESAQP